MFIGRAGEARDTQTPVSGPPSYLHLPFIDCARGYAVLMVIACHLTKDFPALPWPVRRLMMSGWFGVQLFFLASCLTLMMSWHAETARRGAVDLRAFFIRRFFRIAPAYYLAGVLYFVIDPPAHFDLLQALRSVLFINAWQPGWISVLGGWIPVPGGWSIGVEFTFYALFPLFALSVTSLSRAALVFIACVAAGAAANRMALPALSILTPLQRSSFLFFWFPNQACIFPAGGMLYFVLRDLGRWRATLQHRATTLAWVCVLAFCALSTVTLGHFIGDGPGVPAFLATAAVLFVFIAALAGGGVFTNRAAAFVGKLSFSAYLLHFAWIGVIAFIPGLTHTQSSGYVAIVAYGASLLAVIACTLASSWLSWRLIEQPMMNAGRKLVRRLGSMKPAKAQPAIC